MLQSGRHGRRKGVAIREGSVAEARKEAGLTLAEVATGAVSRTAIHLIEKGQTRPSMETLKVIANRTGKPLTFFLDGHADTTLFPRLRDLQTAKTYLVEALAAGEVTREASVQAKVCMVIGQIEEWCGNSVNADAQFKLAIRILELRGKPEQLRDAHIAYAELLETRLAITGSAHHWKMAAEIGRLTSIESNRNTSRRESAVQSNSATSRLTG